MTDLERAVISFHMERSAGATRTGDLVAAAAHMDMARRLLDESKATPARRRRGEPAPVEPSA